MQVSKNASLKPFHSFSVDITCDVLVIVESIDELKSVYQNEEWNRLNKLILGKGSNMLFTEHYAGLVIINRIVGKQVEESDSAWHIRVNAGEDWPELVRWSVEQGYAGMENLAQIPGCAGSAPIQNIGAYGQEFKDVCEYVDVLALDTFEIRQLSSQECCFGYRDSVFKHELFGKVAIVSVGLKLNKEWRPLVSYGSLKSIPDDELSPQRIYHEICEVRSAKLPDPDQMGNAGSFFKNPVISVRHFRELRKNFPDIVGYELGEGVKVAAGWLIDHCGLKGHRVGDAMVHPQQALVLVNCGKATAKDIILLAAEVCAQVKNKYQIELEHEVRFMGRARETYLSELIR